MVTVEPGAWVNPIEGFILITTILLPKSSTLLEVRRLEVVLICRIVLPVHVPNDGRVRPVPRTCQLFLIVCDRARLLCIRVGGGSSRRDRGRRAGRLYGRVAAPLGRVLVHAAFGELHLSCGEIAAVLLIEVTLRVESANY